MLHASGQKGVIRTGLWGPGARSGRAFLSVSHCWTCFAWFSDGTLQFAISLSSLSRLTAAISSEKRVAWFPWSFTSFQQALPLL